MKKILSIVIALLLLFTVINGLAQDKRSSMSVTELKKIMNSDTSLVILDVRTQEELSGPLGKISKAINIPLQDLEDRIDELKSYKNHTIAVICKVGIRSAKAQVFLEKHGYNCFNVEGGMLEYRRLEKGCK